ncbi:MAG: glucose-6-phosphate isomerase, partial [Planctomycetota bacterium]
MIELDFNNILYNVLGPSHSIGEPELYNAIKDNGCICAEIQDERKQGGHAFLDLPYANINKIISFARANARKYENVVVLGIGGSALGTRTLLEALKPPFYNLLSAKQRKGFPRLFILDNVDATETKALLQIINPKKTLFNVVSKSGGTTETIASLLVTLGVLKKHLGKNYRKNLVITTDKEKGFLRRLADKEGIQSFETQKEIQGRYAVLSPVGLLPAA